VSVPHVTEQAAQAEAPQRRGVAMAVIMTSVLMTAADTTIVVLALPEIQRGLHVALSAVVWVIISFLLVITLLATQVGWLGDMFGRVRMDEMGDYTIADLAELFTVSRPTVYRTLQRETGSPTSRSTSYR
jgi:hypothetical protein